jgi:phage terminase small subunit
MAAKKKTKWLYDNRGAKAGVPTGRRRQLNKEERQRYEAFAAAYLAVGQVTYLHPFKAAIAAGYSEKTAESYASKLPRRPVIQQIMQRIRDERIASSTIATPGEVLEVLTSQLRALPDKLVDEHGNFIPLSQLDKNVLHGIAGVKTRSKTTKTKAGEEITETTWEYKLADRTRVAELLSKHHGLFEKDNTQQKADPTQVNFVMMPTGDLSLQDWSQQASAILANNPVKGLPAPVPEGHIIDITPTKVSPAPVNVPMDLDFLDISDLSVDKNEKE